MIDLDDIKARLAAVHAAGASGITVRLEHGIRVIVQMQSWEGNTAHEANAAVTHLLGHAPADLTALVAEVERLREARDAERKRADSLALAYREQQGVNDSIKIEAERHRRIADKAITCIKSAEAERAAVVAWLRKERTYGIDDLLGAGFATVLGILAEAVEEGEHIREGEE